MAGGTSGGRVETWGDEAARTGAAGFICGDCCSAPQPRRAGSMLQPPRGRTPSTQARCSR
eukprot:scaffold19465_cov92-Isochrysis_galbana.AAC.1